MADGHTAPTLRMHLPFAIMFSFLIAALSLALIVPTIFFRQSKRKVIEAVSLKVPYVQFEGDNSPQRYRIETESLLDKGYNQYTTKGLPFALRNPNDAPNPMVVLPLKYLDEVKWLPEQRMSFWRHIDRQSILSQIGGPGITDEVAGAARQGLNRALVNLIEPLQEACLAAYAKEMPACPEWTSVLPYPLIVKIFASMSACVMVGPELGGLDSEWQSLSMSYVETALSAPGEVKMTYPRWLYWLSRYLHPGVKTMWKHRARARELLVPVLAARIAATAEAGEGGKRTQGRRKYEDGVQWLYDAHSSRGKVLTSDQLAQDLFVMMTASIHSTSGAGLCILFDMIAHPDALPAIQEEIATVKTKSPTWNRKALGELRLLDSFMRESARVHALTQYTAVQRVPTSPWTAKDGLTVPAGTTLQFPSYHHNFDAAVFPEPEVFDATRHFRKRQDSTAQHKFHFASVSDDSINWGAGRHACPGRFFAQEALKLMIIHLLTHYEFKHVDDMAGVPRFLSSNMFVIPNPVLPVMIREKKASRGVVGR